MTDLVKLIDWLTSKDTGLSSKEIARKIAGLSPSSFPYAPSDPSDLGRCLRLLDLFPEFDIWEMRTVSNEWWKLVNHWKDLEDLYYLEKEFGSFPKTFKIMRDLYETK